MTSIGNKIELKFIALVGDAATSSAVAPRIELKFIALVGARLKQSHWQKLQVHLSLHIYIPESLKSEEFLGGNVESGSPVG